MANITLTTEDISRAGIDANDQSLAGNLADTMFVPNDGRMFLHFKKSGAGACTVTIVTPGTVAGLAIADLTHSVPATTGDRMIGPFPPDIFNDPSTGMLSFTVSEVTGLTVSRLRLP